MALPHHPTFSLPRAAECLWQVTGGINWKSFIRRVCYFFSRGITIFLLDTRIPRQSKNCHPDRSEAKWRAWP